MNKTHRIVWSAVRQAYVVTHEHATACGKPASTRAAAVLVAGLLAAAPALAATCAHQFASTPPANTNTVVPLGAGQCVSVTSGVELENGNVVVRVEGGVQAESVQNAGTITGGGTGTINVEGPLTVLNKLQNSGMIQGLADGSGAAGVAIGNGGRIELIENSGTIKGDQAAGIVVKGGVLGLHMRPFLQHTAFLNAAGGQVIGEGGYLSSSLMLDNAQVYGDIVNQGTMTGVLYGLDSVASRLGGSIVNDGLISGAKSGIYLSSSYVDDIRIGGKVQGAVSAISLTGGTSVVSGLTLQGRAADKPAELESQGYAVLVQGSSTKLGGMTLAGYSKVAGDVYAQNDAVKVKGLNNRINGALEVQSLMIEGGGELVLDSLNSTSARNDQLSSSVGNGLPKLGDALKTTGGIANNGKLVLAKAETYKVIGNYGQGGRRDAGGARKQQQRVQQIIGHRHGNSG
ncbi:ESPR domain-containing protein [Craterilacuibacter sp. RT1T]|uniref:ESPR domain-containing protein n=1 Tax=Craterilacuibacter sp. RT1T TaxID=2942211 RepID=UPI0020BFCDF4|nr:ESPR domain-containing protein [Craterilacuibacter sp. RT1T]MCL6264466.1 ESPR domain-containing protein [Craterilacuibacter sp. RT1T]